LRQVRTFMARFVGEFNHSIDAKGRVIVPARFRDGLFGEEKTECFVTKGLDGCLFVYDRDEWAVMEEKIAALPLSNPNARRFSRQFLSGAAPCEIDKQGRILLPAKLREYAGLSKDVAVVGVGSHIEIWDLKAWDAMNDFDADEMARNMEDLGI